MIAKKEEPDQLFRHTMSLPTRQTLLRASSGQLAFGLLYAALMLHIAFPKAGFKWRDIPFTIADIVFALLLVVAVFRVWRPFYVTRQMKTCGLLLVLGIPYFGFRILFERIYGFPASLSDDLAELTTLCVYPLILLAMAVVVDRDDFQRMLYSLIRVSVVIVLLYGMAQKLFGEYNVVIPGLTANWDDAQATDFLAQKDNMLWNTDTLKLTSTYQNGNLLGINLLILLPLGITLSRRRGLKLFLLGIGTVVLGLTASRSAWVAAVFLGLLALELVVKRWLHRAALAALLALALYVFLFYVPIAHTRVVEAGQEQFYSWGGRLEPASILWQESLRDQESDVQSFLFGPFGTTRRRVVLSSGGAYEMFYLAVYEIAGAVGVLIWLAPVAFSLLTFYRHQSDPVARAVFLGIAAWLFAAVAEGAFWLPPTAFNFWMMIGMGWLRVQFLARRCPGVRTVTDRMTLRKLRSVAAGAHG